MGRARIYLMATEGFRRWAITFDTRHRFGIPTLPPKGGAMPPQLVTLPNRQGSMRFSDEDVTAVIDLLGQAQTGQAVRLTDEPDDNDNTARRRGELMKDQISKAHPEPIKPGFKVRGHVLTDGEPTRETKHSEKTGKDYTMTKFPQNWAAVSLVPVSEPDDPEATPGNPDVQPAAENPVAAPETPPAAEPQQAQSRRRGGSGGTS